LALGLYLPISGEVLVDDIPMADIHLHEWRKTIGYVSQDLILLNGAVRENVCLKAPGISDEEIWKALEAANADEFVRELAHGLETNIGERGMELSGGQRQRISIARAHVNKPNLLILDEASNALDRKTEIDICRSIAAMAQDVTTISITLRDIWLDYADNVLNAENFDVKDIAA
jgi:ABC-type bacteriocin/lantibiotic exporter with double-glycine peptidase domain